MRSEAIPLVAVIIPAYNAGSYLLEAIDSALEQSFKDFEIIVVDDASNDGTDEHVRPFLDRIKYVNQKHAGSAVARNRGILATASRYVAFLDADDLWTRDKLAKQVAFMEAHPKIILVHTGHNRLSNPAICDSEGSESHSDQSVGTDFLSLLRQPVIHTSSVMVRRDALADAGMFDPKLTNAQDWDLWIRLADVGDFGWIGETLTHYRLHETQSIRSLNYMRNVILADHLMLVRFGNDEEFMPHIKAKLGRDYWVLGCREAKNGNFSEARAAYLQSARYRYRRLNALGRALMCLLPNRIVHRIQGFRRSGGAEK